MSEDGRARSASVPDASASSRDGGCAAGFRQTFDRPLSKPLTQEQRDGLARLVRAGKLQRRKDRSGYGEGDNFVPGPIAIELKNRTLAVSGFSQEMVPTARGKREHQEWEAGQ